MGSPLKFEFDDSGPLLRSPTFMQSRSAFDGKDDRVSFILSTARLDDNHRGCVLPAMVCLPGALSPCNLL